MTRLSVTESTYEYFGIVFDSAFDGHGVPPPPPPPGSVSGRAWSFNTWGFHQETSPPLLDVLLVHKTGHGYDIYSERSWAAFFAAQADLDQLRTKPNTERRYAAYDDLVRKYVRRMHVVGRGLVREWPSSDKHVVNIVGKLMVDQDGNTQEVSNSCTLVNRFSFRPKPYDWQPYKNPGGLPATEAPHVPWKEPEKQPKPEYDGSQDEQIEPIPGRKCVRNPKK